jgi:hypothetical protein
MQVEILDIMKRGHAGSLIFTNFDRHALYDIMQGTFQESSQGPSDRYKYYAKNTDVPAGGRSLLLGNSHLDSLGSFGSTKAPANYSDQIPPFTITLTSMNEYGNISAMHILGVELINEGSGVSIDDIVTETQMTFVARAILGWMPISKFGESINIKADVLQQMNSITAVKQAELAQSLPFRA